MARILVVDDEESVRLPIKIFLEKEGHDVYSSENVNDAIQVMTRSNIDVVITDIIMPKMTGIDLIAYIQKISPNIPVIIMTGEPTVETACEAVRAGAFDYLSKPISRKAIVNNVNNAIRLKMVLDEKKSLKLENERYQKHLESLVKERTAELEELNRSLKLDIKQRKIIEGKLQESELHFISLLENPVDYVIYRLKVGDHPNENTVIMVSPSIVEIAGIEESEIYDINSWFSNVHHDDIKNVMEANLRGFQPPYKFEEVFRFNHPTKGLRWFEVNSLGVLDENGILKFANGIIIDITAEKKSHLEVVAERKRAEFYLDLLSHDVGNIHQGILSWLQLAKMEKRDVKILRKGIINSEKLTMRSINLIKNVKILNQINSKTIKPSSINILEALRNALTTTTNMFADVDIESHILEPKMDLIISAEPIIDSLFINIFHNSIKFQHSEKTRIDVKLSSIRKGKFCKIEISDYGQGIKDEMKSYIFEREKLSELKMHTGLGLQIVKLLVDRYKGTIHIEDRIINDYSRGTKFIITFPVIRNSD